jgi:hypothetical protein
LCYSFALWFKQQPECGQFIDALKSGISNGLAFRLVHGTVRKMELVFWATYILYSGDLMLLHVTHPQVSRETPDNDHGNLRVAEKVQQSLGIILHAGDSKIFSVACVTRFIVKRLVQVLSCDAC